MKNKSLWSVLIVTACLGARAESTALQVRFYPQGTVRAYEVEARRGWSSALLQTMVVANDSADPIDIESVEIELVAEGEVIQTQRLTAKELDRAAKKGAGLEKAGLLEMLKFQFRPDILLAGSLKLADARRLPAKTAILIPYRYFTFAGQPEMFRVRVFGQKPDGTAVEG